MTPYASGKTVYELRNMKSVFYLDRDPITNDAVWYAVTIVTRDGREQKETTPAKVCNILNNFKGLQFSLLSFQIDSKFLKIHFLIFSCSNGSTTKVKFLFAAIKRKLGFTRRAFFCRRLV